MELVTLYGTGLVHCADGCRSPPGVLIVIAQVVTIFLYIGSFCHLCNMDIAM